MKYKIEGSVYSTDQAWVFGHYDSRGGACIIDGPTTLDKAAVYYGKEVFQLHTVYEPGEFERQCAYLGVEETLHNYGPDRRTHFKGPAEVHFMGKPPKHGEDLGDTNFNYFRLQEWNFTGYTWIDQGVWLFIPYNPAGTWYLDKTYIDKFTDEELNAMNSFLPNAETIAGAVVPVRWRPCYMGEDAYDVRYYKENK